jgi:hypothetical protein
MVTDASPASAATECQTFMWSSSGHKTARYPGRQDWQHQERDHQHLPPRAFFEAPISRSVDDVRERG